MDYVAVAQGLLIPFLGTALGASLVFFLRRDIGFRHQSLLSNKRDQFLVIEFVIHGLGHHAADVIPAASVLTADGQDVFQQMIPSDQSSLLCCVQSVP